MLLENTSNLEAQPTGKHVQANLEAKNHAVILSGCNNKNTINAISGAAFGAAGQRCMALSEVVLIGQDWDSWVDELVSAAKKLKNDGGSEEGSEEGADLDPVLASNTLSL